MDLYSVKKAIQWSRKIPSFGEIGRERGGGANSMLTMNDTHIHAFYVSFLMVRLPPYCLSDFYPTGIMHSNKEKTGFTHNPKNTSLTH